MTMILGSGLESLWSDGECHDEAEEERQRERERERERVYRKPYNIGYTSSNGYLVVEQEQQGGKC